MYLVWEVCVALGNSYKHLLINEESSVLLYSIHILVFEKNEDHIQWSMASSSTTGWDRKNKENI